jgi:hypothetical protein
MRGMADEPKLKSAYELALERLKRQDKAEGAAPRKSLTAAQKKEIAELRQKATAKLAEIEILHRDKRHAAIVAGDAEALAKVDEHNTIDRRRVQSELESAIEQVRGRKKEKD